MSSSEKTEKKRKSDRHSSGNENLGMFRDSKQATINFMEQSNLSSTFH